MRVLAFVQHLGDYFKESNVSENGFGQSMFLYTLPLLKRNGPSVQNAGFYRELQGGQSPEVDEKFYQNCSFFISSYIFLALKQRSTDLQQTVPS